MAQPHSEDEGPIAEAERRAAQIRSDQHPLGRRGTTWNRHAPFYVGLMASAGVAVTYGVVHLLAAMSSVLILVGLAMFVALGLEPAVSWLVNHRCPRWAAVSVVVLVAFGALAAFLAAAIPPLVEQGTQLVHQTPRYIQAAQDHSSFIGQINDRFDVQRHIGEFVNREGDTAFSDLLRAGTAVFGALADLGIVAVLTIYFLVDMPRIRATVYRLVPHSRRPRAVLIGDEVFAKVGAYVGGNVVTSIIAGVATFIWCAAFDVPYAVLLGVLVAMFDLIPYGSTVAGIVVAAVALTVSIPVAAGTLAFYVGFRWFEDYVLTPKVIGRVVKVPAGVTVVAVLIGGALLGIVGVLVAIPIAAAVQVLAQELLFPALDEA
ncbi:AI-2E family transporter [Mycobacteroides chelonae]|uniref:AI-2E family transporter n=1 Tax=Mycobacteroides chelonae TaxID=1774 RepID=A0A1S1MD32_MYCCH|nr:AI-2E family transporter [Mycobacteroides chelonae]OHU44683.1 AI-2E family transporter [Mycobacteroides chelonae]OHU56216.1 AI-2E family transporter [Mycobacteroides chelonae]OHU64656.1 AI-2E family transporter [Mycobacteroides chelonae]OHU72248.1 AI-2E family transporter [Mycobacteroides chelonae]OHU80463.1 AI-2E family transporter [Mycobacteroides chelonae]